MLRPDPLAICCTSGSTQAISLSAAFRGTLDPVYTTYLRGGSIHTNSAARWNGRKTQMAIMHMPQVIDGMHTLPWPNTNLILQVICTLMRPILDAQLISSSRRAVDLSCSFCIWISDYSRPDDSPATARPADHFASDQTWGSNERKR